MLNYILNNTALMTLAYRMRRRRFRLVKKMISCIPADATILDVGGTEYYWEMVGYTGGDRKIILFNTSVVHTKYHNMISVAGDAKDLSRYHNSEFHLVHSNSTLQHMQTLEGQKAMANEIRRVGKYYYVQTPNYLFPIEPHFLFLGFQWLPEKLRIHLVQHFSLGYFRRQPLFSDAQATVRSIRLVKQKEFRELFPDATIENEKYLSLTKSFIGYRMPDLKHNGHQ